MIREIHGEPHIMENGYWYPVDYINEQVDEGAPVFFHDREWTDYFIVRAIHSIETEEIDGACE